MKVVTRIVFSTVFIASVALNIFSIYAISNTRVKYQIPEFDQEEYELLKASIREIINSGDTLIGLYPYEISVQDQGYTVRFRTLDFLQIIESPVSSEIIYDGCAYYQLSKQAKLLNVTRCG